MAVSAPAPNAADAPGPSSGSWTAYRRARTCPSAQPRARSLALPKIKTRSRRLGALSTWTDSFAERVRFGSISAIRRYSWIVASRKETPEGDVREYDPRYLLNPRRFPAGREARFARSLKPPDRAPGRTTTARSASGSSTGRRPLPKRRLRRIPDLAGS
jgi:hypothetical protein